MTAAEGRLVARCFTVTVALLVATTAAACGLVVIAEGRTMVGFVGLGLAAFSFLTAYTVWMWERSQRVTVPRVDLSALREDALAEMSQEQFNLLQEIVDEETEREARRDKR
jgi:hypothetical protein